MGTAMRMAAVAAIAIGTAGVLPGGASAAGLAPGEDVYVALGDSYSAGVGAGAYADVSGCRRSARAYPVAVAGMLRARLSFVACSGARIADVEGQLEALSAGTRYVSVSAGGNDAGFARLLLGCLEPWPWDCSAAIARARDFVRDELPARLDRLYSRIRARAPNASVAVAGYPRLLAAGRACLLGGLIDARETGSLNRAADFLRDVLRERALAHGFTFVDPSADFAGHAVCDAQPWIRGLTSPLFESFHPNAAGQAGYAPLVLEALSGI